MISEAELAAHRKTSTAVSVTAWEGARVVCTHTEDTSRLCQRVRSRLSYFADKPLKALNRNAAARRALVSPTLFSSSSELFTADCRRRCKEEAARVSVGTS